MSPWPTIDTEQNLFDGNIFTTVPDCHRCTNRECAPSIRSSIPEYIGKCRKGISYARIDLSSEHSITINSIMLDVHIREALPKNIRKLKQNTVSIDILRSWCKEKGRPLLEFIKSNNQITVDYIIHNLQWPVNAALRYSESLYMDVQGASDKEKIERLPQKQKQLVKAIELIEKCFELAPISVNLDSVVSGELQLKPIYRLLDRFSWVFKDVALANRKTIRAPIGPSHGRCRVYESFELIPLLLIENAIKYGDPDTEIKIRVIDKPEAMSVFFSIESVGDEIPKSISDKIFHKGIRGQLGTGRGLGLYFAQRIATLNGSLIHYKYEFPRKNLFEMDIPAFDFPERR